MNITPVFLLSTGLTLALIAMFVFGLHSLASINRPRRVDSSRIAPSPDAVHAAGTLVAGKALNNADEWEPNAQPPNDIVQAASGQLSCDREKSRSQPWHDDDLREHLSDALHDEVGDESSGKPFAPFHPFMNESTCDAPSAAPSVAAHDVLRCPHCRSARIDTLNRARKAGSTIGSVAGATSGMGIALSGAEAGAVVGSLVDPIGTIFGGLSGAVIAGLVGSAAGCAAGSAVGAAIDDNVLDKHLCLSCGHAFSAADA